MIALLIFGGLALIAFTVGAVTLILGALDDKPENWRQ